MEIMDSNKKIGSNSWTVAIFIAQTSIINIISSIISIPNISIILMLILLIKTLLNQKTIILFKKRLYVYISILGFILFSAVLNGTDFTKEYCLYFLSFGTVALIISSLYVDSRLVIKNIFIIMLVRTMQYYIIQKNKLQLLASLIDKKLDYSYDSIQMGIAFEFTHVAILSLAILLYNKEFKFSIAIYVFSFIELILSLAVIIFDCWTRGAYFSFGIAAFFLILGKLKVGKLPVFISVICAAVFVLLNMEKIITYIYSLMYNYGINIRALIKQTSLYSLNNSTNGRTYFYSLAWNMFKQSPVWGHGIGAFERVSGGIYVHDVFLEAMVELGLIGLILVVYIYYSHIKLIFSYNITYEMLYKITVFFMISFTLITSGTFWTSPIFWLAVFKCIDVKSLNNSKITHNKYFREQISAG